jgi:hypothetical protein
VLERRVDLRWPRRGTQGDRITGFSSEELQDPVIYEKKLAAFIAASRSRPQ